MPRNSGLGAHGIQQAEVGQAVAYGDIRRHGEETCDSPILTLGLRRLNVPMKGTQTNTLWRQ